MTDETGAADLDDDTPTFHASQAWMNLTATDDKRLLCELLLDTYEVGWRRVVLDPDVFTFLIAQANRLHTMTPEERRAIAKELGKGESDA